MATSYFGNDLTALQAAMTAEAAEAAAIERARIAKDAQNMASFFNATSNRQRTEADRRRAEQEDAYRYFALEKQADMNREKLIQDREKFDKGLEINRQQLEIQKKRNELEFDPNRLDPRTAGELLGLAAENDAFNIDADAAADEANLALDALIEELPRKQKEFADESNTFKFGWGTSDAEAAELGNQKATGYFMQGLAKIPVGLGKERAGLVKYNPTTKRFEPRKRNMPPGIPSQLPASTPPAPAPAPAPSTALPASPVGAPVSPIPWDLYLPSGPVIAPPRTNRPPLLRRILNPETGEFTTVR